MSLTLLFWNKFEYLFSIEIIEVVFDFLDFLLIGLYFRSFLIGFIDEGVWIIGQPRVKNVCKPYELIKLCQ